MEPQEKYESCKCDKKPCGCLNTIICILFSILIGVIGLILGTVFEATLIANLALLIALAAIIGLLFVLSAFYKICACTKKRC